MAVSSSKVESRWVNLMLDDDAASKIESRCHRFEVRCLNAMLYIKFGEPNKECKCAICMYWLLTERYAMSMVPSKNYILSLLSQ